MASRVRRNISLGDTNAKILNGEMDLSTWDDEELTRGYRRNKRGTWTGSPPKVVPMAIHNELVKRKMSQAFDLLRDNIVEATSVLVEVAKDPDVDPAVRLKAAGMILDRTLGKAAERIDVRTDMQGRNEPWRDAIIGALVPSTAVSDALDVEVVELADLDLDADDDDER